MNTKPILFSTEMVQAILEGRKTQTRRTKGLELINKNPDLWKFTGHGYKAVVSKKTNYPKLTHFYSFINKETKERIQITSKYGNIDDILWVRETFFCTKYYEHTPLFKNKGKYIYKATDDFIGCHKWKPSIHMPKAAARIFLKVKNIRAERLKDISESDAIAEGVDKKGEMYYDYFGEVPKVGRDFFYTNETAKISFMGLWCKINGVDSWRDNPWVWVIEFEHLNFDEFNDYCFDTIKKKWDAAGRDKKSIWFIG